MDVVGKVGGDSVCLKTGFRVNSERTIEAPPNPMTEKDKFLPDFKSRSFSSPSPCHESANHCQEEGACMMIEMMRSRAMSTVSDKT